MSLEAIRKRSAATSAIRGILAIVLSATNARSQGISLQTAQQKEKLASRAKKKGT